MKCFIMRGLPGSGKSTLARRLATSTNGIILSTDDFWVQDLPQDHPDVSKMYRERWTREELKVAHEWNQQRFRNAVKNKAVVIIDNTNVNRREVDTYRVPALEAGYEVTLAEPASPIWTEYREVLREKTNKDALRKFATELSILNTHGVPAPVILAMMIRWEEL